MRASIMVLRTLVGVTFLTQLVLGILFWTGHALAAVGFHMNLGYAFVCGVWLLAILCWIAGGPPALAIASLVWGFAVVALGMAQTRLMPGAAHWVIQATHLLAGFIAMALIGALTARVPGLRGPGPGHVKPSGPPLRPQPGVR